jgi:hypothetical protein
MVTAQDILHAGGPVTKQQDIIESGSSICPLRQHNLF